jgi:hypothetical protein
MEVDAMQWDLGLQGLGVLVAMSLGFGVIAQVIFGRTTTRWLWAIVSTAHFLGGLFISEVWFGWANEEDLQPNIDGLSFDEVLLIGLVPVVAAVLLSMYVAQRGRRVTSVSAPDGELSTMSREPTFLEHNRREATTKK